MAFCTHVPQHGDLESRWRGGGRAPCGFMRGGLRGAASTWQRAGTGRPPALAALPLRLSSAPVTSAGSARPPRVSLVPFVRASLPTGQKRTRSEGDFPPVSASRVIRFLAPGNVEMGRSSARRVACPGPTPLQPKIPTVSHFQGSVIILKMHITIVRYHFHLSDWQKSKGLIREKLLPSWWWPCQLKHPLSKGKLVIS